MNPSRLTLAFLSLAAVGFAQQPVDKNAPKNAPQDKAAHKQTAAGKEACLVHKRGDVLGAEVRNPAGEKLGKIEDAVLEPIDGTIAYGVLSYGGILGMGDKLFAIPFDRLQAVHEKDSKYFVLAVDKEQLKKAPGFDKSNWPEMNAEWARSIHGAYPLEGAAAPKEFNDGSRVRLLRLDELKGENVKTSDDAKAGEIEDIAIDLNRGHVAYVVLASGGALGFGEDKYAIPWPAFAFSVDDDKDLQVKLKVSKAKFERAPAFEDFKTAGDLPYLERVYTYYEYPYYWTGRAEASMPVERP